MGRVGRVGWEWVRVGDLSLFQKEPRSVIISPGPPQPGGPAMILRFVCS